MGCFSEKSINIEENQNIKSLNKEDKKTSKTEDLNNNNKNANLKNKNVLDLRINQRQENNNNSIVIKEDILNKEQNISESKKELNEEEKEKQEININKENNEDNIKEINKENKKEENTNMVNIEQNKPENNIKNNNDNINKDNSKEKCLGENIKDKEEEQKENIKEIKETENIEVKNKEAIEEKVEENIKENTKESNGNKEEEKKEENNKGKDEGKEEKNINNENTNIEKQKESLKEINKDIENNNDVKLEKEDEKGEISPQINNNDNILKDDNDNKENKDLIQNKNNNLEDNKDNNIQEKKIEVKENIDSIENEKKGDKKKEEKRILKEDDEIVTSPIHEEIMQKLNKDKLKEIAKKAPKRTKTKLDDLITYLKKSTNKMNEFEKGYIIFYWLHLNIEYNTSKKGARTAANIPAEVYRVGKCVCEGYSRLYEYIGEQLGLKVYYISGYAKDSEYNDNYERHAWNVLEVEKKDYLIDATWGAGSTKNNKYEKIFKEFYFCSNPEYLIFTHYPKETKWQLLKSPIGPDEFENRIKFSYIFFENFKGSSDLYNIITTKNEYTIRLYKKNDDKDLDISVSIIVNKENDYGFDNSDSIIDDKGKYIDIKCIFSEKNNFEITISVNSETKILGEGHTIKKYTKAVKYKVEYLDEAEKEFKYGKINNKESLEHDEIIKNLNKDKIKSIINKAPNRKKSSLNDFIEYLKKETKDLTEFEKAYSLFFWIYKNISYGNCHIDWDNEYEEMYKQEKLCYDFTKTFSYILKNIGLNIFDIKGYTKNNGEYVNSDFIFGSNSSWNILEIKDSYYIIFPSVYLIDIIGEEELDFYFCSKPEHFIWSFLPNLPKWQLLETSITKEEFQKRTRLKHTFFIYFDSIDPTYSILTAEKRITIKLNKKNQQNKTYCTIMGLENKGNKYDSSEYYLENLNCKCMVIDKEDYKEIKCIFNKLGKYQLIIRANDGSSNSYSNIAKLCINCISYLKNNEFDFLPEDYDTRKKPSDFKKDFLKGYYNVFFYTKENYNVG